MSTTTEERIEPTAETPEPQPEPVEEPEQDTEHGGETPAPEEPTEPPAPEERAMSERELEQAFDKLDREAKRHRGRLDEILAEAALTLVPCPLCQENLAGWYWPEQLNPEHAQAVIDALAGFQPDDYATAAYVQACVACNGLGQIITGSRVPDRRLVPCRACNGFGYQSSETAPAPAVVAPAPTTAPETFTAPTEAPPDVDFMGRARTDPNFGVLAGYEK
jgi:hypothetical protein